MDLDLKSVLKTTYQNKTKADEYFNSKNYHRINELSNISDRAYENPEKKEIILTYRGTKNLINDIPADLDVLLGTNLFGNRINNAKRQYNKVKKTYPNHQITLTGNSLGGSIASEISTDKKDKIYTHNKGSGLFETFKKTKSNEKHYRNPTDIISLTSSFKSNTRNIGEAQPNLLYAHSIKSLPKKPIKFI